MFFFYADWNTPYGQERKQRPQLMQRSSSMVGAPKPTCLIAPTGQTRVDGQG